MLITPWPSRIRRCTPIALVLSAVLLMGSGAVAAADKPLKESMESGGRKRTYYLYAAAGADASAWAPLLVLLHGSGNNGLSLVDKWVPLAKKEGLIVVGPDSLDPEGWQIPQDGPDFIYDLVEALRKTQRIDPKRVYLFGHSAGAVQTLYLSVLESEYFAAAAAHAGMFNPGAEVYIDRAARKIPISLWVGTDDDRVPVDEVRKSRDALKSRGFPVEMAELPGYTHRYSDRAAQINERVWAFLAAHRLAEEPRYQRYDIAR